MERRLPEPLESAVVLAETVSRVAGHQPDRSLLMAWNARVCFRTNFVSALAKRLLG